MIGCHTNNWSVVLSDSSDTAIIAIVLLLSLSRCTDPAQSDSTHAHKYATAWLYMFAKMAESESSDSSSVSREQDELLPLEGAKNAWVWRYFGFPSRNGQFVEPDKRKRKQLFSPEVSLHSSNKCPV